MAITITTTPGHASANSYATLAEADAFLEIESDTWIAEDDDEVRKRWLVKAQRILTREYQQNWKGSRVDDTQALDWPRYSVAKVDGYGCTYYESTEIPQQVKDAQCLLAAALLDGTFAEGETVRAKSYETDDLSEDLEYGAAFGALPTQVASLLSGLLSGPRLVRG